MISFLGLVAAAMTSLSYIPQVRKAGPKARPTTSPSKR
jgi:hypothetical protein